MNIQIEDYVPFATSAYLEYSKDPDFAYGIGDILPVIGDMLIDDNF